MKSRLLTAGARTAAVLLLASACLFPIYWLFVSALRPREDLFSRTPDLIPTAVDIGVFGSLLADTPILEWLRNSALVAVATATVTVVFAALCAYALSRVRFRGNGLVGFSLFVTQMLPEVLFLVPLYGIFASIGLLNNLSGLVLVNTAFVLPVATWLLKGAIDAVPFEIEEAARVDGASRGAVLTLVVLPTIRATIAAAGVLAFFAAWNEFVFALTFAGSDESIRPMSVGIASFIGEFTTPMNVIMAASLIYALPALIFFVVMQRYVIAGSTAGSVKG